MQTVELDNHGAVVTVLDKAGTYEDLIVHLNNDGKVYLTQYNENQGEANVITMDGNMLADFIGMFKNLQPLRDLGTANQKAIYQ